MIEYKRAQSDMIEMVTEMATKYHRQLKGRKIAVIMQDVASMKKDKLIYGWAGLPSPRLRPLLDEKYDFVICLALDAWLIAEKNKREAIIDHELCHCQIDENGKPYIRPHDYEEFVEIVDRHGFWRQDFAERGIQGALGFRNEEKVRVGTIGGK